MNDQVETISRLGSPASFQARLAGPARELHRAVLRRFLETGAAPTRRWMRQAAGELGLGASAVGELADADLVHIENGLVSVAYPFSGKPTRHRVALDGTRQVYAMCAIDALGLPVMTGRDGRITSTDPSNEQPIEITARGGNWTWEPASAVITHSISKPEGGMLAAYSCPAVNFHTSPGSARTYLPVLSARGIDAIILDQQAAIELARVDFGPLLGGAT